MLQYIYIYIYFFFFKKKKKKLMLKQMYQLLSIKFCKNAKSLVVELIPPHVQSAWRFKGERVRTAGLTTCCNYFSKKKIM